MSYPPSEYPGPREFICEGEHMSRNMVMAEVEGRGSFEVEMCADPCCAKVFARCNHEKNSWSEDGRVLNCDLCGVDGT